MRILELDFNTKSERSFAAGDFTPRNEAGVFYWIIAAPDDVAVLRPVLEKVKVHPDAADAFTGSFSEARYDLHENAVHFSITEAWRDGGELKTVLVDFLLGPNYLFTRPERAAPVLEQMLRIYREDFKSFARSSGFLLFELASLLIESYRRTFTVFAGEIERIQLRLFDDVSDEIFPQVSQLTADLLGFRRMVLASRDLFKELATRKSSLVSETTQPSLDMLAARMERLGDDLDSERAVLAETLNLYMGMVSHRTNKVVNRLTILSMLFLPLGFLCGVYGMNFSVIPETQWEYGYYAFWFIALAFVVGFVVFIKKRKWI